MSSITLGKNQFALMSQRYLGEATGRLGQVYERLSSGQRINRPSDDAASGAISAGLQTRSRVYTQGVRNAQDAISALNVADSTAEQLGTVLFRIKELATQSANGTFSLSQRLSLDKEASELTKEFNRLAATAKFNGISLLSGGQAGVRLQAGYGVEQSLALYFGQELSQRVGNGTFSSPYTFTAASSAALDTADFDGDGDLDMLMIVGSTSISVLANDGNGNFSTTLASYSASGPVETAKFIDYDGDGRLDVAMSDQISGTTLLRNDGTASFSYVEDLTVQRSSQIEIADLDGDGVLDIALSQGTHARVLYGAAGAGTFALGASIAGVAIGPIAIRDTNGDGRQELLANTTSGLQTHSFNASRAYSTTTQAGVYFDAVADINRDGYADLVLNGSTVNAYYGGAGGTYGSATALFSNPSGTGLLIQDMNGDGNVDILTSQASPSLQLWVGDGQGSFTRTSFDGYQAVSGSRFLTGDMNGDGVPDIIFGSQIALANSVQSTNLARVSLLSAADARSALSTLEGYLSRLGEERSALGASMARVESIASNLRATAENMTAAASRIVDADIGQETASLVRLQISQQAAAAVSAQANLIPNLVLQLLGDGEPFA